MAKIQIKSEKLTPFGGIFSIMEKFEQTISPIIDQTLGLRCSSYGYQSLNAYLSHKTNINPVYKWGVQYS